MKVMTYNILTNSPRTRKTPRKRWECRREAVIQHINILNPDLLGIQEGLLAQVHFLKDHLNNYAYYGEGSLGGENGPQVGIFYKRSMFKLNQAQTFWLSITPNQPSKSWDSAYNRICSFVHLTRLSDNKTIIYFNTHLDHKGSEARLESVKLILSKIEAMQQEYPNANFILSGDFNANPTKPPYLTLANSQTLCDAYTIAQQHDGATYTFSGIDKWWHLTKLLLFIYYKDFMHKRIDYVFVDKNLKVKSYCASKWAKSRCYPSDHLPILIEVD